MTTEDFVRALRDIANFYEKNPDVTLPELGVSYSMNAYPTQQPSEIESMIGPCDRHLVGDWFYMRKTFGAFSLDFNWPASAVAEDLLQ